MVNLDYIRVAKRTSSIGPFGVIIEFHSGKKVAEIFSDFSGAMRLVQQIGVPIHVTKKMYPELRTLYDIASDKSLEDLEALNKAGLIIVEE